MTTLNVRLAANSSGQPDSDRTDPGTLGARFVLCEAKTTALVTVRDAPSGAVFLARSVIEMSSTPRTVNVGRTIPRLFHDQSLHEGLGDCLEPDVSFQGCLVGRFRDRLWGRSHTIPLDAEKARVNPVATGSSPRADQGGERGLMVVGVVVVLVDDRALRRWSQCLSPPSGLGGGRSNPPPIDARGQPDACGGGYRWMCSRTCWAPVDPDDRRRVSTPHPPVPTGGSGDAGRNGVRVTVGRQPALASRSAVSAAIWGTASSAALVAAAQTAGSVPAG